MRPEHGTETQERQVSGSSERRIRHQRGGTPDGPGLSSLAGRAGRRSSQAMGQGWKWGSEEHRHKQGRVSVRRAAGEGGMCSKRHEWLLAETAQGPRGLPGVIKGCFQHLGMLSISPQGETQIISFTFFVLHPKKRKAKPQLIKQEGKQRSGFPGPPKLRGRG